MDITEINAIEYGGAIAHVAAAQLFQILTASENMEGPAAVNWFGGEHGPQEDAAATVLLLAEYVTKRGSGGERLWIWGSVNGLVVVDVPASRQFADVVLARRLAFDMFASVCLRSFEQLTTLQEAEFAARQLEQRDNPPIALDDSIFEPTGSLGELEKHAPEFFALQAKADEARAQGSADDDQVVEQLAGADSNTPPPMSIGAAAPATGEAHEEEIADQGSKAGGQAGEDPDRAKEIRDSDAGNGAGGQSAGNDGAASSTGENAKVGGAVAKPTDAQSRKSDDGRKSQVRKPQRHNRRK